MKWKPVRRVLGELVLLRKNAACKWHDFCCKYLKMRKLVEYLPSCATEGARNVNAQKVSLDELLGGFLLAVSRLPLHSRVQF
jgi:hypothetical protein